MIPAEAIERYLARVPRAPPAFKGVPPRVLSATVYDQLGLPIEPAKTPPRGQYQLEGLAFALYLRRALLFYDMRLGKSWIALNWAEHLRRSGLWQGKGLVIVHAPIALDVWDTEAPKHSNLKVRIVHTKQTEFIEALESDCDLVVVPWSGLQQIFAVKQAVKVHKLVNKQSQFVRQNKVRPDIVAANMAAEAFSLVIIDEIDRARNRGTLRFKIATALVQYCELRLGLTGTPFGRNPFDLWAQTFLVDAGKTLGRSYNFFCNAFGKESKDRRKLIFDHRKESLLRTRMNTISLSYERAEVHDVNIMLGQIELHMCGEQREAYSRALDRLIKIGASEPQEMIASFVRMRQISSGYLPFTDEQGIERVMTFPYNPKVEWLTDLFKSGVERQIIIFHEFIRSGDTICKLLAEAKVTHGWLYGGTKDTNKVKYDFVNGHTQVLVANAVKGGMAIDLPVADYVLFWESPTSPVIRQQAEARPMSRGAKLLMIDDLVCSNVERRILSFIKEGKDLLQNLVHVRRTLME